MSDHPDMSHLIPDYLDYLRAGGASERTIRCRRDALRQLHDHLPMGLAFARTGEIAAWLAAKPTRGTKSTYRHHIRGFYAWATSVAQELDGDPSLGLPRVRVPTRQPRPITDEELATVLGLPLSLALRTAAVLAAYAGLRCCEIVDCERGHITEEVIYVLSGKGDQPGVVPTHPLVWATVQDRPPGRLVVNRRGNSTAGWLSEAFGAAMRRHGLVDVTAHRLRHWYGTAVHEVAGDAILTQQSLRHVSPTNTAGYVRLAQARLATAVRALPVPGRRDELDRS